MGGGSIRFSLVLNSKEQHEEWKNYETMMGYGNFSQMVRCVVEMAIKRENEPSKNVMEPIQDALEGLYKLTEATNEWVEIMSMRLANRDENSEVNKAAREILELLSKEEMALSQINGKFNYSQEVVNGAVILINDLGLIGSRKERSKRQDNSGEMK